MKRFCKAVSVISACALAVSLVSAYPQNVFAAEGNVSETSAPTATNRTEYISDLEGFMKFAEECRIDSASYGLNVELNADISLNEKEFYGIPIFCGTFDGNGHTISGLNISDSASESGLFRHVERSAVIKNLVVSGSVSPSGSGNNVGGIVGVNKGTINSCEYKGTVFAKDSVGGIAGKNEESGVISGCKSFAVISAESTAGGICGNNLGILIDCANSGNVNAVYSDIEVSAENIGFDNTSVEGAIGKSDIGGVAGYSSGIIRRCSNSGTVGYQHTGYNIGGVVGRQCGMLESCANTGEVYGRKDVGGIAGQMEPYCSIEFSEDTAQRLGNEMDTLSELVEKLISDAGNSGDRLNSEIQSLTSQMNAAQKNADDIADRTEEIFNGYSDGINELLARADKALDDAPDALNSLDEALELISDFADKCTEALRELEQSGEYAGDAVNSAKDALNDIDKAIPEIESALRDVGNALREIQSSLGDPEEIKTSMKDITKSLDKIMSEMKDMSDAAKRLDAAFQSLSEWLNGSDWQQLKTSVTALSDCLSEVLDALGSVSGAVSDISGAIDSGEMNKAFIELNSATAALGRAAAKLAGAVSGGGIPDTGKLDEATDELQSATQALQKAAEHLNTAVDPVEMQKALDELQSASQNLKIALDKASAAAEEMSGALDKITGSSVPEDTMKAASEQIGTILDSVSDISDNLSDINAKISDILDDIDAEGLSAAMGNLSDAFSETAKAAGSISVSGENVDKAADALGKTLDSVTSAASKAGDASDIISKAGDKLSEAVKKLEDMSQTLSGESEVRFPALDERFSNAADSLSENMKAMISTLSRISSKANSEVDVLLNDISNINDCLERIFGIFKENYRDLLSEDEAQRGFSEDISETESANSDSNSRHGKALDCVNSGKVEGDVNIGGITGAMAIEFDLDPEDDIARNGNPSINFSYNVMDIIESCENSGEIIAKKNYCGGIVGRMDMGLVKNARASGAVSSTSGNYVGGIAGYSSAKLRECVSKVTLSGASYIGGIAGEGGIMTDCLSISDITGFSEKIGALAGYVDFSKENTEILRNFFVDRGVAGIDRISYAGLAEPFGYAEFAKRAGDFADIVVEFFADGEMLEKITVPYGGSLNPSDIPEIPNKSGYYARWEDFDFENITFPKRLNAEYIQLITSIAADKYSEDGLSLILADGNFDENSRLLVETESSAVFAPEGAQLRIVTIDSENAPTALRFLKTGNNAALMQYINGAWKPVQFTENGSYLIVENPSLENGTASFCVSSSSSNVTLAVIIAAAGVTVVAVIVIVAVVKSKSHKKEKALTK